MEPITLLLVLGALLLMLLSAGLWVALALFTVAFVGLYLNDNSSIGLIMATTTWGSSASWSLAALPLFIWMGEILFRTRLSDDLFRGLSPWLNRIPGRLLHVNILGCGIFAAISGSSAATAATIGRMTAPELTRRGYDERMIIGTLAGSGTLGLLIPPSIILIVYGVSAEISIARLFIAGALPGLMLVLLFMGYTSIWALFNPKSVPTADTGMTFAEKIRATRGLMPVLLLILFVLGSIYGGLTTATEAASLGVLGALILSLLSGTLDRQTFIDSLMGATRTSCMIAFILAGAAFLTVAMAFTGIPAQLAAGIATLGLSTTALIVVLTVFFVVLGTFLDGISVVVLTTSVVLPMVVQANIDLLWFGIYVVMVVEMSQITPPVGFNLFVLQGLTGRNILRIAQYSSPFFLLLLLAVVLITTFPEIATWLPQQMTQK